MSKEKYTKVSQKDIDRTLKVAAKTGKPYAKVLRDFLIKKYKRKSVLSKPPFKTN